MKFVVRAQKFSIYLFIFSLNFESIDLFCLGISYLATKISIVLLLFFSVINFKDSFSFKVYPKYIEVISIFFCMLTFNNFLNRSDGFDKIIDLPFFLNLLVFMILINYTVMDKKVILKGLLVFALSSFFLTILYFVGYGGEGLLEGRSTIFGMNENNLGITLCVSIFILISIVFENKLMLNKNRALFLFPIPFLLIFMVSTGSRVAFLSFLLGGCLLVFNNNSISKVNKFLFVFILFFFLSIVWMLFLKNTFVVERLFDSIKDGDLSSRDLIWVSIFDVIVNSFVFGIGQTGYMARMDAWSNNIPSPHNVFIEVVCYTGVVGLFIFLLFLKRIYNNAKMMSVYGNELLPIVLLTPLFGNLLSGQLFDVKYSWILLAYIVSDSYNEKD